MTVPTLEDHDILLTSGATTIGINIAKDKSGNYLFSRKVLPVLSEQQYQTLGEQAFIPQLEQPFTQAEWHAGFGKQLYTSKRYLKTTGADASYKGLVIPGPVKTATTNSNPTQTGYNMGFENWTTISSVDYLNNWAHKYVSATAPYTKDTTNYQGGAASVKRNTKDIYLVQALGVTAVADSIITVTWYGRATTSNASGNSAIYNASGGQLKAQGNTYTAGAGWVQKTMTYTFVGTVSNPIIEIDLTGGTNNESWLDTVVVAWTGTAVTTLTTGTVIKQIDFNGNSYLITSTGVWKRSAANWVWVGGSPPGLTDAFEAISTEAGGPFLVLCGGPLSDAGYGYFLMRTDEGFIISSAGGSAHKINHGDTSGGNDWASDSTTTNLGYKYSALLTATGTSYTIGTTSEEFTKVRDHLGIPYFEKEDRAYYVNSSGTVIEIAQELRSLSNANTGKNAISWRGNGAQALYIPAGAGASLLAYDAGDVEDIGPQKFAEQLADFKGQIVATASDDEWLYIVQDNGTKIEILKGRYESIDGTTDFRWHPFVEDTYTTVAYAFVSSITAKRLYYGGGTALPKYIPLPVASGDPLTDTTLSFLTATTFETSWWDMGLKNVLKNFRSVGLRSASLSGTARTLKIEYDIDDGNGYVELGGSGNGTFNTSPYQEKFFADGVEARYIKFRVTFTTDDSTVGLGLKSLTLNYILNPTSLETWEFDIKLDKDIKLLNTGDKDVEQTYPVVAVQLWNWKNTIPLTFTFSDGLFTATNGSHDGTTKKVRIAPNGLVERPITFARNIPLLAQEASLHITLWEVRTS